MGIQSWGGPAELIEVHYAQRYEEILGRLPAELLASRVEVDERFGIDLATASSV